MGNNKETKETRIFFKTKGKAEYEWAKKRGKDYLLELRDMLQFAQEMRIQQRFWELKDIHYMGGKTSKPAETSGNTIPKLWPLWTHDDVVRDNDVFCDDKAFELVSEAEMNELLSAMEKHDGSKLASDARCTTLCLSSKCQDFGINGDYSNNGGTICNFDRASIIVSPSESISMRLYMGDNHKIDASLNIGWVDIFDGWGPCKMGYLVFADKDKQEHIVELEDFSALVEIVEDNKYIFTHYSKDTSDMMFIWHLTSLNDVELFSDRDVVSSEINESSLTNGNITKDKTS